MTNLKITIETLIEQNANDFEVAKAIKNETKLYLNSLDELFNQTQGKDFFVKHTKKIDMFIIIIYKYLLRKHFGNYLPMSNSVPITLIALGSYGREQLCVYSDIDIMLLYEDVPGFNVRDILEEFMTIAWDCGLKLGHRVHEITEIENEVKTDVTIKTSILESRLIYGSKHLWFYFQNKLSNIRAYEQKEFILEKMQEHKQRLLKYPLSMQPNIKDGYGAMRETNMLFWIATITYGVSSTKDLINVVFTEEEYKTYRIAIEFIFRVRNALHLIAKKKLDIVNFDVLPELSRKLGFIDKTRAVKEIQCMTKLFNSLHTIHRFSSIMIKKISRQYFIDMTKISQLKASRYQKNIYICKNKVFSSYFIQPLLLIDFIKLLNSFPNEIDEFDKSFQYFASKTILASTLTKEIKDEIYLFLQKDNLTPCIKLIYNAKLFKTILPSQKRIINQAQFDGYHIHPVDIHTIETLWYVENIQDKFIYNLYETFTKKEKTLLKLLALFHDSGKGRNKDHHIVGEKLFKKFAKSFGIENTDAILGAKLIRYHNMMNKVATTEDIYSQDVILAFTGLLQTQQTLKLLYVLTYADISAVGESIYSSSTANLLRELFLQSLPAFENKELLKVSSRRVAKENAINNTTLFKEQTKLIQKKIINISSHQLFLKYKAIDIIKIALFAKNTNDYYFTVENKDALTIRITRAVALNLGYLLSKITFLNIRAMGIYKLFDDKKFFEIVFDSTVDNDDLSYIENIIQDSFDMSKKFSVNKPIFKRQDIKIDCEHTQALAEIKIIAKDQNGLFSYIAKVFDDFNVEINSAKIYSNKGKIKDLILVEKSSGFCQNQEEIINLLT